LWLMLVSAAAAASDRPNIILFVADDLGYGDIGCYGNAKNRTPHLDALAAEGMRFTDFHANGPMCTPTRVALLTGQYQNRFGRIFEGPLSYQTDRDKGLPVTAMTIADALKPAGYATAMFGKWHLGYRSPFLPTRQGFDEFRGLLTGDGDHHSHISRSGNEDWWLQETLAMEAGYSVDLITQHSIDFIERHRDRPFFLYVAHLAIHFPWQGPNEEGYRRKGHSYWNLTKLGPHSPGQVGPAVREMVEAVDQSVGKIVATLRQLHLERRTLLFFTSDNGGYLDYAGLFHGEISSNGPLRGQKGDTFEGGHRVPAIASWPGQIQPGSTTHATAMTMDLMPTCLELAGRDVSRDASFSRLDGTTLTHVLLHGGQLPPRTLFWRSGHKCAVRRGPWKLVVYRDDDPMLFNLESDIGERHDLAAEKPTLVRSLSAALTRWEQDVAVH
jgi:arylsulfatase A